MPKDRRIRWKLTGLLAVSLLTAACGLSDDGPDNAIDSVQIAAKTDVPAGTKLVVAEQNDTQSLPWNLANAGKDAQEREIATGVAESRHFCDTSREKSWMRP